MQCLFRIFRHFTPHRTYTSLNISVCWCLQHIDYCDNLYKYYYRINPISIKKKKEMIKVYIYPSIYLFKESVFYQITNMYWHEMRDV